jgi:hypothetical protein
MQKDQPCGRTEDLLFFALCRYVSRFWESKA